MTILLYLSLCTVKYCIKCFHHGVDATLIAGSRIRMVISCAGAHWLSIRILVLLPWIFLSLLEGFGSFALQLLVGVELGICLVLSPLEV